MNSLGTLTVITGPSGVGKGTLVKKIIDRNHQLWLSISATTRRARDGEVEGKHYFFLDKEEFSALVEKGGFLEWAEFADNRYGTPRLQVIDKIKNGIDVLLEIELEGARQIRKSFPEGFQIFLAPPTFDELEKRIRGRGTDSEKAINLRLQRAKEEISAKNEFDAVVINNNIDKAVKDVEKLMYLNNSD